MKCKYVVYVVSTLVESSAVCGVVEGKVLGVSRGLRQSEIVVEIAAAEVHMGDG